MIHIFERLETHEENDEASTLELDSSVYHTYGFVYMYIYYIRSVTHFGWISFIRLSSSGTVFFTSNP